MVTTSYAAPQDVKDKIGYTDDQTTDADLQSYIEEAHRTLEMRVGREFLEETMITEVRRDSSEVPTDYSFELRPVLSVDRVYVNDEIIDSSNYTIEKQDGVISFTSQFRDEELDIGDVIQVETVPKQFKDLEVWYAISAMYAANVIQTDDDQVKVSQEEAERRASKLETYINQLIPVGTVTDGLVRRGYK